MIDKNINDKDNKYRFSTKKYLKYWDKVLLDFRKKYNVDVLKMIASGDDYDRVHRVMTENNFKPLSEFAFKIYKQQLMNFDFVADNIHNAVVNFLKENVSFVVNTEIVLNAIVTAGFSQFLQGKKPVDLVLLLRALELKLKYEKEGLPEGEAVEKLKKMLTEGSDGDRKSGEEKVLQPNSIQADTESNPAA
jgi:hypothetical protein